MNDFSPREIHITIEDIRKMAGNTGFSDKMTLAAIIDKLEEIENNLTKILNTAEANGKRLDEKLNKLKNNKK